MVCSAADAEMDAEMTTAVCGSFCSSSSAAETPAATAVDAVPADADKQQNLRYRKQTMLSGTGSPVNKTVLLPVRESPGAENA